MDDDENAARDNDLRVANNVLKFWFACPIRRCRRARSCVGDSAGCHAIFCRWVSEEVKGVVAHVARVAPHRHAGRPRRRSSHGGGASAPR